MPPILYAFGCQIQIFDIYNSVNKRKGKDKLQDFLCCILSAIIDNIPIVYAVLTAHPSMDMGQWLLITLTAGTGGSLLSIGSAAGVALMGQARGVYTFFAHLKWAWAILLGYAACIVVHLWMNAHLFDLVPLER